MLQRTASPSTRPEDHRRREEGCPSPSACGPMPGDVTVTGTHGPGEHCFRSSFTLSGSAGLLGDHPQDGPGTVAAPVPELGSNCRLASAGSVTFPCLRGHIPGKETPGLMACAGPSVGDRH